MTYARNDHRNRSYKVKPGSTPPFEIPGATVTYEKSDGYSYRIKLNAGKLYQQCPNDLTVYHRDHQDDVNRHAGTPESKAFARSLFDRPGLLTVQHIGNATLLTYLDRSAQPAVVIQQIVIRMIRQAAKH